MANADPQTPRRAGSLTRDRPIHRLRTDDPDELAAWLGPVAGSLRLVPLSSRFRVDVRASRLDRTGLFEIQHDDLRVQSPQRDYWSLTIARGRRLRLKRSRGAFEFGGEVACGVLPSENFDLESGRGACDLVANVDWEDVCRATRVLSGGRVDEPRLSTVVRADAPRSGALLRYVRFAWSELQRTDSIFESPLVTRQMEDTLLSLVASLGLEEPRAAEVMIPPVRRQALSRAMEFIEANLEDPLSVLAVARAAGASMRTLDRAFRDHFATSVHRYIVGRRIERIRRELLAADPQEVSVTDIALRFGFTNPGRLAQQYKQMFSELPSETLRS